MASDPPPCAGDLITARASPDGGPPEIGVRLAGAWRWIPLKPGQALRLARLLIDLTLQHERSRR